MSKNSYSDLERLHIIAERIHESGLYIKASNQEWVHIGMGCASMGEAAREDFHLICQGFEGYSREESDAKFSNCLKTTRGEVTLGSVIQFAKEHGIDTGMPHGRRPMSEEAKEEQRRNIIAALKENILRDYTFRKNTLANRLEAREKDGEWEPWNDREHDTVITRMRELGFKLNDNMLRSLLNSEDISPDFHPFTDWIKTLPEWHEGDHDHEADFIGYFEFTDKENTAFYNHFIRRFLRGMVALALGMTDHNPLDLLFEGEENVGKSHMTKNILPPHLREYQAQAYSFLAKDKDQLLMFSEKLLLIYDEIDMDSRVRNNFFKYASTAGDQYLRDSYGHYRKNYKRVASIVGTTNDKRFIYEAAGDRRYLGVSLAGTKSTVEFPINYEGLYAQLYYEVTHNGAGPLTPDEVCQIKEHNEQYVMLDDTEELLKLFFRKPAGFEQPVLMTPAQIKHYLMSNGYRSYDLNPNEIGKAMTRLKFESKHTNKGTAYRVVKTPKEEREPEKEVEKEGNLPF
ncbi:MAG: DUF3874 domain-containing protein [Bacteroidaceae bacterium]|nr:DUF3874 domain-containing protein [Bacteroidaceae bacterium]